MRVSVSLLLARKVAYGPNQAPLGQKFLQCSVERSAETDSIRAWLCLFVTNPFFRFRRY